MKMRMKKREKDVGVILFESKYRSIFMIAVLLIAECRLATIVDNLMKSIPFH